VTAVNRRPAADPGPDWADGILAPLRRTAVTLDAAPGVMRRIAAVGPSARIHATPSGAFDLLWAGALAGGLACLALLGAVLGVMVFQGDEGVRTLWLLAASAGRLLVIFGRAAGELAAAAGASALAIARTLYIALEWTAPLLRGGALVGAACGAVSILVSASIVARAGRAAPFTARHGRVNLEGGSR